MCLGAIIGGATSILGASAAGDAADAQAAAAQQQLALQQQVYEENVERFQPYYDGGTNAFAAQNYLLGLGPAPTIGGTAPEITTTTIPGSGPPAGSITNALGGDAGQFAESTIYNPGDRRAGTPQGGQGGTPASTQYQVGGQTFATLEEAQAWANANPVGGTPYGGFQESPGYQFAVEQGIAGIDASKSAGGNLYSGATMQDALTFNQGMANQEFNNYYNQVAGIASAGQAAAGQQAQAGANYATGGSNALANVGNAQAAGAIGQSNALLNGINTGLGIYQYQNALNGTPNSGPGLSLF